MPFYGTHYFIKTKKAKKKISNFSGHNICTRPLLKFVKMGVMKKKKVTAHAKLNEILKTFSADKGQLIWDYANIEEVLQIEIKHKTWLCFNSESRKHLSRNCFEIIIISLKEVTTKFSFFSSFRVVLSQNSQEIWQWILDCYNLVEQISVVVIIRNAIVFPWLYHICTLGPSTIQLNTLNLQFIKLYRCSPIIKKTS